MVITRIICNGFWGHYQHEKKKYAQKNVLSILRFISMLFKYLKKGMSEKIVLSILRFVSMHFKYLKKGISKNFSQVGLTFVSMLFSYLKKGYQQKIVLSIFDIYKYAFNVIFFSMNEGYRNKCVCIYSFGAFLWLNILINFENGYTGGRLIFSFAWNFRGLSQTAAKKTTPDSVNIQMCKN